MTPSQIRWINRLIRHGIWTALGLLSAVLFYFGFRAEGRSITWPVALLWQMPGWYLWDALTPLIRWLARRFSPGKERWAVPLLAHLGASVSIALVHLAFLVLIGWLVNSRSRESFSFIQAYRVYAATYLPFEVLIYWVILVVGYALENYRKSQARELNTALLERQLSEARLHALKMQLHPHFLFNTLNAIAILVRKQENGAAVEMLSRLSDLLRYVLDHAEHREVSLAEELDFIQRYLEIEEVRFGDRLAVKKQIAPESLDVLVPSLILQPLVENAIRHGIQGKDAAGWIALEAWNDDGKLCIRISDDGPGLMPGWQENSRRGIGLSNTRERLAQLYENDWKLELMNGSENGGLGAVATICIPYKPSLLSG